MHVEGIVYVVFPYPFNFADSEHVVDRVQMARKWCSELLAKVWLSVCPLLHHHILASSELSALMEVNWIMMRSLMLPFMNTCGGLHVLMMPGWEESLVVKDCIDHAKVAKKQIAYVNVDCLRDWLASLEDLRGETGSSPVGGSDLPVRALETSQLDSPGSASGELPDAESVDSGR